MKLPWPPTDDAEIEAYRLRCIKDTIRCALTTIGLLATMKALMLLLPQTFQ